jgi:predicted Zn-dependent protease
VKLLRGSFVVVGAALLLLGAAACKSKPSRADQVRRGDELFAKKEYLKAASAYGDAAHNGAPSGPLLLKEAEANLRGGRPRLASDAAARAASLMPDNLEAQRMAARLMLNEHRFSEVEERLSKVAETHPTDLGILIALGNAKARMASSVVAFDFAVNARTKSEFVALTRKARSQSETGASQNGRETDAEAEKIFRRAIEAGPDNIRGQMALANFLWAVGRADDAEPVLKRVADENTDEGIANLALGVYYAVNQRAKEAEHYLKVAKEDDSGAIVGDGSGVKIAASFALADLYEKAKRDAEVTALLEGIPQSHRIAANVRLASFEFRHGKTEQALTRVNKLLQEQRPPLQARLLKAQILIATHHPTDAIAVARELTDVAPKSDEARATLGQALFAAGDLEKAFDEYQEATRLNPQAPEAFVRLAEVAAKLGRTKEADIAAREGRRLQKSVGG